MIDTGILLEPFAYAYMVKAVGVCALVGAVCGFLSAYLVLKGWSLMGDALAHSVVPGVALAYLLAIPYAVGAFFTGMLAAAGMALVKQATALREDTVIGLVFTAFFAGGLLIASINPVSVNLQGIVLGNILAISDADLVQVCVICLVCAAALAPVWRDLVVVFFDERHARGIGLPVSALKILFFTLLSAAVVAALQTVGACLVIAMVVTPGATAYLLHNRFGPMAASAALIGTGTGAGGAYASYFLDVPPGGLIVLLQTGLFAAVLLASRLKTKRGAPA